MKPQPHAEYSDSILRDACLHSLATFAETMLPNYKAAAFHRHLARQLDAVLRGACPRLCVSVPPRMGKSLTASVIFAAWALTKNPRLNIILASHAAELAEGFSLATRQILSSEAYLSLFPPILSVNLERSRNWQTLAGGSYFATGVGGGGLGRGADILILDDLVKNRDDAESVAEREKTWGWLTSTALTRLSPSGVVIVIGSRWHEDDVIGRLTSDSFEGPKFTYFKLQALCESPETDPLRRKAGESIWPERWTVEKLAETRATIGRRDFASHYQQAPSPIGGNLVDVSKIRVIDLAAVPPDMTMCRAWDLSLGLTSNGDFSAGARGGLTKDGNFVLMDINRGQRKWTEQREVIIAKARLEGGPVGVETVAAWEVAAAELRTALSGVTTVKSIKVSTSKEARATGWVSMAESGKFFMVQGSWNSAFLRELEQFPNGRHDDQVDAVSLLWEMVRKRTPFMFAVTTISPQPGFRGIREWRYSGGGCGLSSLHQGRDND